MTWRFHVVHRYLLRDREILMVTWCMYVARVVTSRDIYTWQRYGFIVVYICGSVCLWCQLLRGVGHDGVILQGVGNNGVILKGVV